jgi:transcriptional regulator with XRE-family HTH domain
MPKPPEPAKGSTADVPDEGVVKDSELVAFGAGVRAFREAAGMTQEGLAAAAELHWTYIGQIERGERNLTYKNVLKLARGLGVSPTALIPD